jgi:hypothetical protein
VTGAVDGAGAVFGPAIALRVVRYGGALAQRGYRLNSFLVCISRRENRDRYMQDEEAAMAAAALNDRELELLRARDYAGMLAYGVNIYAVVKAGYVFGATLLDIGKQMRLDAEKGSA